MEFKYFQAFTPEQAEMCKSALKDLDPVNFRLWDGWAPMLDRLQSKRPIVFVSAPSETSLRVTSNMGSQPMFGLNPLLKAHCGIEHDAGNSYKSDDFNGEKWLEFQALMTFWGVVIQPEAPLALNAPQVFALAPKPPPQPQAAPGASGEPSTESNA